MQVFPGVPLVVLWASGLTAVVSEVILSQVITPLVYSPKPQGGVWGLTRAPTPQFQKKRVATCLFMGPIGGEPRLIFGGVRGVRDNQWSPLLSASTLFPLVTNRV